MPAEQPLISSLKDVDEQAAFHSSVLDSLADHIAVLDPKGDIVFVNRAWRQFTEVNSSPQCFVEPVGQNYLRVCQNALQHPNGTEAAAVKTGLQAVLSGTQLIFQLEYPCHSPTERRWFLLTFSRLMGAHAGVVASHTNITARKLADEVRRETETRFQTLVNNLHVGVIRQGPGAEILSANPRALELLGLTEDQIMGLTSFDPAWNVIHEDGSPFPGPTHPVAQAIAFGRPVRGVVMGVYRPTTKDRVWLEVDAEPQITNDGVVFQVICTFEDITARRKAESALQLSDFAVQHASVATIWCRPDARIIRVNSAACKLLGYTEAEMLAFAITDLNPDYPAERWPLHWRELREKRQMSFETRYRHKAGHLVLVEVDLNWIEFGGQEYSFGFVHDITATRALEEQFRQAQKMEAIGTLAGGIAHDFNNILSAIIGYTELAKLGSKDHPVVREHLAQVLTGAKRAGVLVKQILAFSRRQSSRRTPVQFRDVVAEPLKLLRATLPATIEFDLDLDAPLPSVLADPTEIHQVIMNLCTNAGHAMKDRPGWLGVKLESFRVDDALTGSSLGLQPGPYVRLEVSDTGHGMDAATKARIFEPFFTTKGLGEGTGLGLAVVHGIMKSHGGAVKVDSTPGQGTVFHLYFPVTEAPVPVPPSHTGRAPIGHGQRILFVDDEKPLAYLGQKMLEQLNYVVEIATEPTEALALVQAHPTAYDLVITDLTMPGMTGIDLARRILHLRPDQPIILATGFTPDLTAESVRQLGIRELLMKPMTQLELGESVHRVLAGKATH